MLVSHGLTRMVAQIPPSLPSDCGSDQYGVRPAGPSALGSHSVIASGRVARVATTGILDASFDPNPDFAVYGLRAQANDQVLICGSTTTLAGSPSEISARVEDNGTVDGSFLPGPGSAVQSLTVLTDGKVLATGYFTEFQPSGDPRSRHPEPDSRSCSHREHSLAVSIHSPPERSTSAWLRMTAACCCLHPGSYHDCAGAAFRHDKTRRRAHVQRTLGLQFLPCAVATQWRPRRTGLCRVQPFIDSGSTWTRLQVQERGSAVDGS